jgi:hypothetical protein
MTRDTYEGGYAQSRERFERDTADHEMTILHDDDLYRHLRFQRPGSSIYWFDIVTWPGRLVICGDCEDYMFSRLTDMFEFFAGERQAPGINPHYWSEKLQGPGRDPGRSFSWDALRAVVIEWFEQISEREDLRLREQIALADALEAKVLHDPSYACQVDDENTAFRLLGEFEWHDPENHPDRHQYGRMGLQIYDPYDCDLRDYDWSFLWCCWAIVRGIEQYREALATA